MRCRNWRWFFKDIVFEKSGLQRKPYIMSLSGVQLTISWHWYADAYFPRWLIYRKRQGERMKCDNESSGDCGAISYHFRGMALHIYYIYIYIDGTTSGHSVCMIFHHARSIVLSGSGTCCQSPSGDPFFLWIFMTLSSIVWWHNTYSNRATS